MPISNFQHSGFEYEFYGTKGAINHAPTTTVGVRFIEPSTIQAAVYAAQHGMIWVGLDLLPGNNNSKGSVNDLNRLGSFWVQWRKLIVTKLQMWRRLKVICLLPNI